MDIPFIHASLAGLEGFVMCCRPKENLFSRLYAGTTSPGQHGAETLAGTPTPTPAVIAQLQIVLALQTLIPRLAVTMPHNTLLHLDLTIPELEHLIV